MKTLDRDLQQRLLHINCALARTVQRDWAAQPVRARLSLVKNLRHEIADQARELASAAAAVADRPVSEKLISEVLPLADACRWLEREAASILAPRYHGRRHRPFWLSGASFSVQHQALGLVLVIGPRNYPLFLPAVQALHALVAGNAVLLKPAPGTREVALLFRRLFIAAGLDPRLLTILPEDISAGIAAVDIGVDKVFFTGSSEHGRDLLQQLAVTNTPSVMELSGEDAVIGLADADIDLMVRAIRFGLHWNNGDTCIAPRRILAHESIARRLRAQLLRAGVDSLEVETFAHESEAIHLTSQNDFALGVSIFSRDVHRAAALAGRITTGFAIVNDLLVPTADPRLPFGGVRASGFGVTRGREGLLEMTHPHAVVVRRGQSRRHYEPLRAGDDTFFADYIVAAHGRGLLDRGRALRSVLRTIVRRKNNK